MTVVRGQRALDKAEADPVEFRAISEETAA